MDDLPGKGGKINLWIYTWLKVTFQQFRRGQNTLEKEVTLPTLDFYALLMRPATRSRGDGGVIHRLDLLPLSPPAIRGDCLVD